MENTSHWEPFKSIHFHIKEVIPSTLRPHKEAPWIEPHYICLQLFRLPLKHTSLERPLISHSSFHIHAHSEDFQYGLDQGLGQSKKPSVKPAWSSMVAGTLTGTCPSASAELYVRHHSSAVCIQCNTLVMEMQNGQLLPHKCPGALW